MALIIASKRTPKRGTLLRYFSGAICRNFRIELDWSHAGRFTGSAIFGRRRSAKLVATIRQSKAHKVTSCTAKFEWNSKVGELAEISQLPADGTKSEPKLDSVSVRPNAL